MTCAKCSTSHGVSVWPTGTLCWRCALMGHQRQGVEIGCRTSRFAFFWEPGAGKTILILGIVAENLEHSGCADRTLVIAPKSILYSAWLKDAEHFPQLKCEVIWHTSAARRRRMIAETSADVLVTNYETFKAHAEEFLAVGVRRLVIDESGKLKGWKTQISKAAFEFSRKMDSVYILSGTPAPNNQTEYFGQMRCVDAALFGTNFYKFAFSFFTPITRNVAGIERTIGWKLMDRWSNEFNRPVAEEFHRRLSSRSMTLRKQDCLDLPPKLDIVRDVELGEAEKLAYETMLEELRVDLPDGDSIDARLAGKTMKLRQITGGMVLPGGGGRPMILGTAKLDALAELLDELGDRPCIIWAQCTEEITRIVGLLRERGASAEIIDGRITDARRRGEIVGQFQAGGLQYLVCHPEATGHGQTFTRASYTIFYSFDYNADTHGQARDRIHRIGQTAERCTYFYLSAKGTIDERMFWVLKNKQRGADATKEILSYLRGQAVEVAA
jgi:SNF2 family DNA or RNA helicase